MTEPVTVPCADPVHCELTVSIQAMCPLQDEIDSYDVTVTWRGGEETFEKWWLLEALAEYDGCELTQEELCATIYKRLLRSCVHDITVTVVDTKHMDMTVSIPP